MGMHHAVCVPRVVVGWPLLATLFGPHCVVGSACARTLLAHRHPHCTATPIAPPPPLHRHYCSPGGSKSRQQRLKRRPRSARRRKLRPKRRARHLTPSTTRRNQKASKPRIIPSLGLGVSRFFELCDCIDGIDGIDGSTWHRWQHLASMASIAAPSGAGQNTSRIQGLE